MRLVFKLTILLILQPILKWLILFPSRHRCKYNAVAVSCCLHIKNRSDLYPAPFFFLLFKAKKRISVVTSLTQNKVQKKKKKRPRESPNTCEKNMIQVPRNNRFRKNKKQVRVGKPKQGSRAHRSKLGS